MNGLMTRTVAHEDGGHGGERGAGEGVHVPAWLAGLGGRRREQRRGGGISGSAVVRHGVVLGSSVRSVARGGPAGNEGSVSVTSRCGEKLRTVLLPNFNYIGLETDLCMLVVVVRP